LSGFNLNDVSAMTAGEKMATVSFTALKQGTANLSFDYERGNTGKTTLVEAGTSRNMLGKAEGLNIIIE